MVQFVKGTMFLQQGAAGWSESWYFDGSTSSGFDTAMSTLLTARANLLASNGLALGYRVAQTNPPGTAHTGIMNVASTSIAVQDLPQVSIFVRVYAVGNQKRLLMLRGIPDSQVVNAQYAPSGAYAGLLANYQSLVQTLGCRLRVHDTTEPVLAVLTVDTNGLTTFAGAHGLAVGNYVKFFRSKASNLATVKKTYQVLAVPSSTTAVLNGWPAGITLLNGRAYQLVYKTAVIAGIGNVIRATTRKAGRPFGQPRGRLPRRPAVLV